MSVTISEDTVKVATALIDQVDRSSGDFLTDEQKRTFQALRAITDPEEKAARTSEMMTRLIADAQNALNTGGDVRQQAAAMQEEFTPEARQAINVSVSQFEGKLRSDAQAELRNLTSNRTPSGTARRGRIRI